MDMVKVYISTTNTKGALFNKQSFKTIFIISVLRCVTCTYSKYKSNSDDSEDSEDSRISNDINYDRPTCQPICRSKNPRNYSSDFFKKIMSRDGIKIGNIASENIKDENDIRSTDMNNICINEEDPRKMLLNALRLEKHTIKVIKEEEEKFIKYILRYTNNDNEIVKKLSNDISHDKIWECQNARLLKMKNDAETKFIKSDGITGFEEYYQTMLEIKREKILALEKTIKFRTETIIKRTGISDSSYLLIEKIKKKKNRNNEINLENLNMAKQNMKKARDSYILQYKTMKNPESIVQMKNKIQSEHNFKKNLAKSESSSESDEITDSSLTGGNNIIFVDNKKTLERKLHSNIPNKVPEYSKHELKSSDYTEDSEADAY